MRGDSVQVSSQECWREGGEVDRKQQWPADQVLKAGVVWVKSVKKSVQIISHSGHHQAVYRPSASSSLLHSILLQLTY